MSVAIGHVPGAFGQGGQDPHFLHSWCRWGIPTAMTPSGSAVALSASSLVWAHRRLSWWPPLRQTQIWHQRFGPTDADPVVLAKQIATLDYLSRGAAFRSGLGQDDPTEYEACGVSKSDRGQRTDEAIVLMRRLWQEDHVTHEGAFSPAMTSALRPNHSSNPRHPSGLVRTGGGQAGGPGRRRLAGLERHA